MNYREILEPETTGTVSVAEAMAAARPTTVRWRSPRPGDHVARKGSAVRQRKAAARVGAPASVAGGVHARPKSAAKKPHAKPSAHVKVVAKTSLAKRKSRSKASPGIRARKHTSGGANYRSAK
jgi:hypothetical protein